ncbi:MAG: ABC transporter ATP-binding protein [Clostridiales bacterium]|nr:ABC transporter ATP-binding protein [Clostridiales bacterium]
MIGQREPLIEVKGLTLDFAIEGKRVNVLEDVNLAIGRGQRIGLVGESGCGKSITSLTIMGLQPQTAAVRSGEILYAGRDLLRASRREMIGIRGSELAMIFQEPMTSLNPVYTVGQQMAEMFKLHTGLSPREALKSVVERLREVSIPDPESIVNQYPHQLSGGMRQRVMIAMAMSLNPKLLIADEPTTALDVTIQAQILDLIRKLNDQHEASVLLITHDLGVVAETCEHVVVMYAGHVVEEADVFQIFEHPRHPYTVGLMKSLPDLNEVSERLYNIKGTVPPVYAYPRGCRFSPRCEYGTGQCAERVPELAEGENGHRVRCFNPLT